MQSLTLDLPSRKRPSEDSPFVTVTRMLSRDNLFQACLSSCGQSQIALSQGDWNAATRASDEVVDLWGDLTRLREVPDTPNPQEELQLRFLARCRLLELDEYRITNFIGAGKCGSVFKAQGPYGAAAIKLLLYPRNEEELARFEYEADLLTRFNHKNIVRGYTGIRHVPFLPVRWFAMGLISGQKTLAEFVAVASLADVLSVFAEVCDALAYAHGLGVVHRDLHFENVMVLPGGVRVLDFGSAKHVIDLFTFRPVGGLRFAAPEKIFNPGNEDGKSDVFAVGAMLFTLLNRVPPFYGKTFGELVELLRAGKADLPKTDNEALRTLVIRAIAREPNDRPTAQELAADLRHCF
jgi:eukaryotic-like serine/threonine-protein kinase